MIENSEIIPNHIKDQVSNAVQMFKLHLNKNLKAIYLYGSAVHGGLKPDSDIDLMVVINHSLDELIAKKLLTSLLSIS